MIEKGGVKMSACKDFECHFAVYNEHGCRYCTKDCKPKGEIECYICMKNISVGNSGICVLCKNPCSVDTKNFKLNVKRKLL